MAKFLKGSTRHNAACLVASVMMLAALITPAMGCGDEQVQNSSIATISDRSWVKSDHVLYAAINGKGVFRLQLNSNDQEPLAVHSGDTFVDFKISPSGRYLIYQLESNTVETPYFYDLKEGVEHRISGFAPYSHIISSPDDKWFAVEPRPGEPLAIRLLDLRTAEIKQVTVPTLHDKALTFAFEWSRENQLLFGVRENGKETFLKISPETGQVSPVEASRAGPYTIVYSINSIRIQTACEWCSVRHALSSAPIVGGGTIVASPERLVLRQGRAHERVIVEVPRLPDPAPGQPVLACGSNGIRMTGVFDGRYVLFSVGRSIKLYGVQENLMALLPIGADGIIGW